MSHITFNISEVDTKIFDHFKKLCFSGGFEDAANVAKIIIDHTKREDIKKEVREIFTKFAATRYSYILSSQDTLNAVNSNLCGVYLNRASKKTDISSELPGFSELANVCVSEGRSLLHYDRLHILYQSVLNVQNVNGDIVELGVYRGGSLKFISNVLKANSIDKKVFGFDTFEGHLSTDQHDGGGHESGMFSTAGVSEIFSYIACDDVQLVVGDASITFKDFRKSLKCISLAHFDMDLHKPTADVLPIAWDLLSNNGIILMDDYGFKSCPGVKKAVDDYFADKRVLRYHLMTGQMVIVKQ